MQSKNQSITLEHITVKCNSYFRIGHRALAFKDEVLIIGGTGLQGEFVKPILRMNLENSKI